MRRLVSSGSPLEPVIGFSRAVRVGEHVFVAATAASWPDGRVEADVGVQCRRCLEIIEQALLEADAALKDVVRTRVFLLDPDDGAVVSSIHGEVFAEIRPVTGFIIVSGFRDPRWRVELGPGEPERASMGRLRPGMCALWRADRAAGSTARPVRGTSSAESCSRVTQRRAGPGGEPLDQPRAAVSAITRRSARSRRLDDRC